MSARYISAIVLVAGLATGSAPAHSCGHCKEDKVAATYDHSVITAAQRNGHTVVFLEIRGEIGPTSGIGPWIRKQVEASTGVVRGTARVSLAPAALSFACERQAVAASVRSITQKLAPRGLELKLIEAQAAKTR